jgi:hypothetical protein
VTDVTEVASARDLTEPSVSVIVAVLNRAGTLQRCLDSIADQDHPNVELIVIDGGSTDGTLDIIEGNSARIAHWESGPDRGIYDAWNKALQHASGRWICFLGADDYFIDTDSLVDLVRLGEQEDADLVCGRIRYVDERGERRFTLGSPFDWSRMKRSHSIAHTGMLHHRRLFERWGHFDPQYRIAGDYEFLLRLGPSVRGVFLDRVYLAMGDAGVSSLNLVDALREARRIQARHAEIGAMRSWLHFVLALAPHVYWFGRRALDSTRVVTSLKTFRESIRQGG